VEIVRAAADVEKALSFGLRSDASGTPRQEGSFRDRWRWRLTLPTMRVWLDDMRDAPEGWVHVRSPDEAITLLSTGEVIELSLDHDLGLFTEEREDTGYDVLAWLERQVADGRLHPPGTITVHSANPVARRRMSQAIKSIRLAERQASG
jgi:hypothetical protein